MKLQQLYSLTRQAVDQYELIQEGDRIAVGISGGKDSLTLLYALAGLKRFYPKKFEIEAITVDLGIDGMDFTPIQSLCEELQVHYTIVSTEIKKIVFDVRKEENPCSLCAKLRKGALNDAALKLNCNVVAYAHHKDDIIETLLMSLFFEGRIHTFEPKTYLDQTGLTVIRPLMLLSESDVIGFQNKYQLPVVKNLCPADGFTKREEMKVLLKELSKKYPGVKDRIFTSVRNYLYSDEQ
ncbi:MAG: tRNA 2-thiocytidine biosynthesis TtcA family protein [Lachnospiraceae bacterium]